MISGKIVRSKFRFFAIAGALFFSSLQAQASASSTIEDWCYFYGYVDYPLCVANIDDGFAKEGYPEAKITLSATMGDLAYDLKITVQAAEDITKLYASEGAGHGVRN